MTFYILFLNRRPRIIGNMVFFAINQLVRPVEFLSLRIFIDPGHALDVGKSFTLRSKVQTIMAVL